MSLGIKSFATEGVGTKNCSGNSRWISGFTMGFWIHDGFLDSRWVPGFAMGSWIHDIFLDQAPWLILGSSDLSKWFKTVRSSETEWSLILGPKSTPSLLDLNCLILGPCPYCTNYMAWATSGECGLGSMYWLTSLLHKGCRSSKDHILKRSHSWSVGNM